MNRRRPGSGSAGPGRRSFGSSAVVGPGVYCRTMRVPGPAVDEASSMIRAALEGDPQATRTLVDRLAPVVQSRVTRGLLRRSPSSGGRDVRQEVEDFTQEVFLSLFRDGGRALRAWDPARGLSLENFVGLLAQHQVASILRTGKSSPWVDLPTEAETLERAATASPGPEQQVATREMWESLQSQLIA